LDPTQYNPAEPAGSMPFVRRVKGPSGLAA
jgi:hypothetical protein